MDLKNIKLLGGIGAVLYLLGSFPLMLFFIFIPGLILMLIAFKKISDINPREGIFKNFLISAIFSLIVYLFSFLGAVPLGISAAFLLEDPVWGISLVSLLVWIVIWLLTLGGGYFAKKALFSTAKVLNQDLFRLGGNFIFWGSVGAIIVIGFLAIFVGWILVAVAFFALKDNLETAENIN